MIDTRYEKPLICAFQYNWFIDQNDEHWAVGGSNRYAPTVGNYRSNDPETFRRNYEQARRSGIDCFATSVWFSTPTLLSAGDDAFKSYSCFLSQLAWMKSNKVEDFSIFVLYELENGVQAERQPSAADILSILEFYRGSVFSHQNYTKKRAIKKSDGTTYIDNSPVFLVYSQEGSGRVAAWVDGVQLYEAAHPGETVYLCLEVCTDSGTGPGWTDYADRDLVDCWYKYAPWGDGEYLHSTAWIHSGSVAIPTAHSAYDSFTVCPGGETASDGSGGATRDAVAYIAAWNSVLTFMAAAPANVGPSFIFICSWDEWGEASIIAPSPTWTDGVYNYPDGLYMEITAAYATLIKGEDSRKVNKFNISDGGG